MSLEKKITVNVRQGVHGRVATRLAQITRQYDVSLHILLLDGEIDCSSVLDVLSMAFVHGTCLRFRADGQGAEQALDAVKKIFMFEEEP